MTLNQKKVVITYSLEVCKCSKNFTNTFIEIMQPFSPKNMITYLIKYHLYFQTPFGTAVIDMDYDQTFEDKLKSVEKNYYSSYLVEFFEKRTPRNLESITVDWKSV